MRSVWKPWLVAACMAAGAGCGTSDSTQVVTGRVTATGAIAVRAIAGGQAVTAGRVRSDGSFTLALPAGKQYRLEVLTTAGVSPIVGADGVSALAFGVCRPTDPFDMGGIAGGAGGGTACPPPPPPPCDATTDPNCKLPPPPPPPCDPATDPGCTCPPPPPPPCDPASDPDCKLPPPPCDPTTDPTCPPPPPPCDPTTDPTCPPPPPCAPTTAPTCKPPPPPPCDPTTDACCPLPPPPCPDPTDPNSCKDPCMTDPSQCGTGGGGAWPAPCDPADPSCKLGGGMLPAHPPGDFGCKEPAGS